LRHPTHAAAAVPSHTPPAQVVPAVTGAFTQLPLEHTSLVHVLPSPQSAVPAHSTHAGPPTALSSHAGVAALQPPSVAPAAALSTHVAHAGTAAPSHTPPAHAAPSGRTVFEHTPAPHASVVHALPSAQSAAPMHSTHAGVLDVSHSGAAALQP
jgi:hypothetical protein